MNRLAAIDTGTNSTRLLIAELGPGGLREIVRETTVTRLGEGVDRSGRLSETARQRVYDCVARYAAIIGELEVQRALVVATSSVRDAADGESFLQELAERFSFGYLLLSGDQEASLAFTGAVIGMEPGIKRMMFDVGGGSTEVVVGVNEDISFSVSMDMGCVRIRERYLHTDPPLAGELKAATKFIDDQLKSHLPVAELSGTKQALAVAGTVTALAAIDLELEAYDRELVHGHRLSHMRVQEMMRVLAAQDAVQRHDNHLLETGRSDVIVAGALIVERLLTYCGVSNLIVSEHDILDGIALAMLQSRL